LFEPIFEMSRQKFVSIYDDGWLFFSQRCAIWCQTLAIFRYSARFSGEDFILANSMHSAANSRNSVDGSQSSKVIPLSSFIFFWHFLGHRLYENSRRDYCELICRGLMVHANRLLIQANKHAIHRPHRRSCCFVALVDVRHPTSSALKDIKVGQVPKSRRCSSERHKLSAAWAMQRPGRVFTRGFVTHRRNPVLEPQCGAKQMSGSGSASMR
jgi:hypothetical protein